MSYVNLATERDWVVRFKALSGENSIFPKSFALQLAENAGVTPTNTRRRIAWLRTPSDGSDTFQTVTAETLLGGADDPIAKAARADLKDKVVIIGGLFPDIDQHQTPLSSQHNERMAGAVVHAHIVAELVDGRSIVQLESDSWVLRLELAVLATLGFLVGWRFSFAAARSGAGQYRDGIDYCHRHICVLAVSYHTTNRARSACVVSGRVFGA